MQTVFRTATAEIRVADTVIPHGRKILMFLGAPTATPRRWSDTDAFELARDTSGHVAFGRGIHQCAGQHAARWESEALPTALTKRVATIEISGRLGLARDAPHPGRPICAP